MTRNKTNLVIDTIGYLSFLVLLSTGIIMKYILLPGSERVASDPTRLMGYARHDWGTAHFWASVVFISALIIHLFLHWKWLVSVCRNYVNIKTSPAVVAALAIPLLLVSAPFFGARGFEGGSQGNGRGYRGGRGATLETSREIESNAEQSLSGFFIQGRTTLADIERETGVSVSKILIALDLPKDIPVDKRLSELRNRYDLRMSELRDIVEQLAARNLP